MLLKRVVYGVGVINLWERTTKLWERVPNRGNELPSRELEKMIVACLQLIITTFYIVPRT